MTKRDAIAWVIALDRLEDGASDFDEQDFYYCLSWGAFTEPLTRV
jgi:hypothetical protein